MNHLVATYIDFIQSIGIILIFFILTILLTKITKRKKEIIEVQIKQEL